MTKQQDLSLRELTETLVSLIFKSDEREVLKVFDIAVHLEAERIVTDVLDIDQIRKKLNKLKKLRTARNRAQKRK